MLFRRVCARTAKPIPDNSFRNKINLKLQDYWVGFVCFLLTRGNLTKSDERVKKFLVNFA